MPVKPTTIGEARKKLRDEQENARNQRNRQQQPTPKPAPAPRRTPWATGSKKGGWGN